MIGQLGVFDADARVGPYPAASLCILALPGAIGAPAGGTHLAGHCPRHLPGRAGDGVDRRDRRPVGHLRLTIAYSPRVQERPMPGCRRIVSPC